MENEGTGLRLFSRTSESGDGTAPEFPWLEGSTLGVATTWGSWGARMGPANSKACTARARAVHFDFATGRWRLRLFVIMRRTTFKLRLKQLLVVTLLLVLHEKEASNCTPGVWIRRGSAGRGNHLTSLKEE